MLKDREEDLYSKYMAFNSVMLEEYKPIEIAAIMIIQGLTFYKSTMSEKDYQLMVKSIYDSRNDVKTF